MLLLDKQLDDALPKIKHSSSAEIGENAKQD
jgi:hypothetical protein